MNINFNITIDDRIIGFFKKLFTRRNSIIAITAIVLLAGIITISAENLEWDDFQPGDPVSAGEINDKINKLRDHAVPTGTIMPFAGPEANIPDGWLLCDGSELDPDDYPDLYTAIGTSWGAQDNNFLLPDLRGRFLRGLDNRTSENGCLDPDAADRTDIDGNTIGNIIGSYQSDAFQGHRHIFQPSAYSSSVGSSGTSGSNANTLLFNKYTTEITTDGTNGVPRISSETRPTNATVNYIIKY